MIADTLDHAYLYEALGLHFARAFQFLRDTDVRTLAAGRYAIDGTAIFALVQEYETQEAADKKLEMHRAYIDIQYIVSGCEIIAWAPSDRLTVAENYYDEKDIAFAPVGASEQGFIKLDAGSFAVYFPGDAHKPGCIAEKPCTVKKVVVKIAV